MTAQPRTTQSHTAAPAPLRRRTRRQFIPPQHGAWAMLLLPWLVGILAAGPRWSHLPLLGAWLSGYLCSYYALQAVKTGRVRRFRAQLLSYATPTVLLGALVLVLHPRLLWYAPGYALLLAVNAWYARRRDDRALLNDLASVVQSCLMVFVCATVAGTPVEHLRTEFLAVTGYFTGTVLYVKTMIRERGHRGYRRASVAYHLGAFAVATWHSLSLGAVFGLFLARAWLLPTRPLTPKQVGLIEIACSALLLGALILA